jgi:hypothetical protein
MILRTILLPRIETFPTPVVRPSISNNDTDVYTDTSIAATPQESGTPTPNPATPTTAVPIQTTTGAPISNRPLTPTMLKQPSHAQ